MKMKNSQKVLPIAILALGAVLAGGVFAASTNAWSRLPKPSVSFPKPELRTAAFPSGERLSILKQQDEVFADIADEIAPSVVNVRSESGGDGGQGSGFVYTSDGWIVTNDHVVGGAKTVTVVLSDGRELKGTVYSTNDPDLDLALVKIDASGLKALPLGDSDQVRTAQYAIAAGSPFGLEKTVTIGHVSATNRSGSVTDPRFGIDRGYKGMIQTDASINPGNSGGPLLNIDGQVIGVNSTIFSLTGSSAGVGFALPSNTVKIVADEIIQTKKFDRGILGINLDSDDIKPYRLAELGISGGALAANVGMDGPAFKAGIRDNDVILSIDGKSVANQTDLLRQLYMRSPNQTVTLEYLRGKEKKMAQVKLTSPAELQRSLPQEGRRRRLSPDDLFGDGGSEFFREQGPGQGQERQAPPMEGTPKLGIGMEDISPSLRSQFSVPANVSGVVILSVVPGSPAEKYGLKVGDILMEFNGEKIASADDVIAAMKSVSWTDTVTIKAGRYSKDASVVNTFKISFR